MGKPRRIDFDRIDVGALVRLLTVVECGSINRSAQQMNMTQPTLTRRIRRLENALGQVLLSRNADGVSLTAFGQKIISHARDIEASLDNIVQLAAKVSPMEEIRVGATPLVALYILSDVVRSVTTSNIKASLRIVEGGHADLLGEMRSGALDIVVAARPVKAKDRDLEFKIMSSVRLGIVASAFHPLVAKCTISVEDLRDVRWALPESDPTFRQRVDFEFARRKLPPILDVIQMPSPSSLLRLVRSTETLTVLPIEMIQSELDAGGLTVLKGPWRLGPYPYGVYLRRTGSQSATLQQFVQIIDGVAGKLRTPNPGV